jgi:Nuclease-related domain
MTLIGRRRGSRRAGRSSIDQFRARRRKVLRESWRDWLLTVALAGGCVVAAVLFDSRPAALIFAGLAGSAVTVCLVGWIIGGDVYSLPWMWGAIGERQTAEALNGLDDSWTCEHDLPRRRGNWDHVLVGPPGVFLLDSKRLTSSAAVNGDTLVAGRSSYSGGGFRGPAASLHDVLAPRISRSLWVQAVVVIWGDFPQRRVEKDSVVYLHGSELLPWLRSQPGRLSANECDELVEAVREIRAAGTPAS